MHDVTNGMTYKPSEDQLRHQPSLIRVFAFLIMIALALSYLFSKQQRLVIQITLVIFSSPEPLGSQGELIVYQWSGVRRRPQCSNIFFSETAWPIKAKFYVEPPWEGGTKVYINGPGHMTNMAATPIYGKNPSKMIFSRTGRPIFTKLGM